MTIKEAQEAVDQWIKEYGVRYFSELTNMACLTEEVGELARVIARTYGDQSFKKGEKTNLGEEMADVLWVLICLANQTGVDLTEELQKSFDMNYTVHYEDDDVLSLSLHFLRLPYGANGNHVTSYDLVYDKTTGERIPLENYVRITLTDLKQYLGGHSYDAQGEKLRSINSDYIKTVPDNYFLEGNGVVCLVFQPYQLAAGCFGNCYVRLEPQYIEYLNRKNQW